MVIGKLANVQAKADLKKGDEMNVEMTGADVNMGFNSKYLLEALRSADYENVNV